MGNSLNAGHVKIFVYICACWATALAVAGTRAPGGRRKDEEVAGTEGAGCHGDI